MAVPPRSPSPMQQDLHGLQRTRPPPYPHPRSGGQKHASNTSSIQIFKYLIVAPLRWSAALDFLGQEMLIGSMGDTGRQRCVSHLHKWCGVRRRKLAPPFNHIVYCIIPEPLKHHTTCFVVCTFLGHLKAYPQGFHHGKLIGHALKERDLLHSAPLRCLWWTPIVTNMHWRKRPPS